MSDTIFDSGTRTYRFEFGSDEKIYSADFTGNVPPEGIDGMLRAVGRHLLKECAGVIRSYLGERQFEYMDLRFEEKMLSHEEIMKRAASWLCERSCEGPDGYIGDCDHYYAAMDCQKWIGASCLEGCYYAVKRVRDAHGSLMEYKVIGQTFRECGDVREGCFAIREERDGCFHDLARTCGEPVFSPFGCIDTLGLLLETGNIKTVRQAAEAAIR